MVIGLSGKGGVGKSTLSALVTRHWVRLGETPVLAVDADPNSTLGEKVGLVPSYAIGDLREDTLTAKHTAPSGVPKQQALEYAVQDAIAEGAGYDLVAMGRGEGPGCYCAVNNMLRTFLDGLTGRYRHVVIDNEAGMEHLSRRTNGKVDLMLIVSDPTPTGFKTAVRIAELASTLGVVRGRMGLVLNRVSCPADAGRLASSLTDLEFLGCVPLDPAVADFEERGESLLSLPDDSPAADAVSGILTRCFQTTAL